MNQKKSNCVPNEKDDRTRNWSFILYPESVQSAWRDTLDSQHIQWIESPLHDRDLNATGEPKKPHVHILLLYDGKKSYSQIEALTASLTATIPQKVSNAKGLVRYFCHLDNPEKAQYSISDIIGHGGADPSDYLKPRSADRYSLIREMLHFCDECNVTEISDLLSYSIKYRYDDWFPLLCDNSCYVLDAHLRSRRNMIKGGDVPATWDSK